MGSYIILYISTLVPVWELATCCDVTEGTDWCGLVPVVREFLHMSFRSAPDSAFLYDCSCVILEESLGEPNLKIWGRSSLFVQTLPHPTALLTYGCEPRWQAIIARNIQQNIIELTLGALEKNSTDDILKYFSYIFLSFDNAYFLDKIRKLSSICPLLNISRDWYNVTVKDKSYLCMREKVD